MNTYLFNVGGMGGLGHGVFWGLFLDVCVGGGGEVLVEAEFSS